jgi:ATP-dependent DNA helicase DinG
MPTEPLGQARVEDMQRRGINPFINYTVPTAVIKFRQGFGRLIRTNSDYGIVALLDSRVISKSYGKTFFTSLPRCKFVSGTTNDIIEAMKKHICEMENKRK